MNFKSIFLGLKKTASEHSPEILTGIGIAGMISTTILAVRATPKALILIEELKKKRNDILEKEKDEQKRKLIPWPIDVVKTTVKCYIPSIITGGLSVFCLIGANSVNMRRNAALATAYTLSESALKEYRSKVIETIGEKKEHLVRDSVAKDRMERDPVTNREIILTEKGNTLCYDAVSGRYFKSDIETIRKAVNELNYRMRDEVYISLNDLYSELGLDNIGIGDDIGWNINLNGYIDIYFSSQLAEDGTPCLVLDYSVAPVYGYRKY